MKIICFNIWGGHFERGLLKFFTDYQNVDIFCLQEVYYKATKKISTDNNVISLNILSHIMQVLPQHQFIFHPIVSGDYGLAIIAKNNITIRQQGGVCIYHNRFYLGAGPTHSRYLHWIKYTKNNVNCYIVNLHGLWNGKGKLDTPERDHQTNIIIKFLTTIHEPFILCGDFNLNPNTKSMQLLSSKWNNLIKNFNITSTRSRFYEKPEKYADYIFVSNSIIVNDFNVFDIDVSDHCPLYLDYTI